MSLQRVGVELVAEGANPFLRAIEDSNKAVRNFGRSLGDSGPQFGAWETMATGALHRVGAVVTDFALNAGKALIGFGVDSVMMAADYETTLNRFSAATNLGGQELKAFDDLFLQLGKDTTFSAQQAADAGVELAKAGLPIESIMGDATEATLALAAAGEIELKPAAEIVSKQLAVWADTGLTATQAVDLLTQAAGASSVGVDDLALGLYNANAAAKAAGIDYEELVTAMALTAGGFASAAENGTSWKNLIPRLIPSTKDATLAMMDLGLFTEETGSAFYNAQGDFVGMEETARLLEGAFKDLTEADRSKYMQMIFSGDAMAAANLLVDKGAEGYRNQAGAQRELGSALQQGEKLQQGLNHELELAKGSWESLQIMIGRLVTPALTHLFQAVITPAIDTLGDFVSAIADAGFGSIEMYEVLGNVGEKIMPFIGSIAAAIPQIRQAFLDWAFAAAQWALDAVPGLLAGLETLGQAAIGWVVQNAITFGTQMLEFGKKAVEWIAPQLPELGNQLGAFLDRMVTWVVDSLPAWVAQLQTLGMAAIDWVTAAAPGLANNLGLFAGNLLGWIVKTTGEAIPKLAELGLKFVGWVVTDVLPKLPGALLAIWEGLDTFISTTAEKAVTALAHLGAKFNEWVAVDVLPVLPSKLEAIWETIKGWVGGIIGKVKTKLQEIGSAMIDGITEGVKAAAGRLYDATVGAVWDAITGSQKEIDSHSPSQVTFDLIGTPLMDGITEGVLFAAPALESALVSSLTTAMDAGKMIAQTGAATIGETLGGISSAAQIAAFQAAMGSVRPVQGGLGEFGSGGGHRIQPVMTPSQISHASNVTNYSNAITYNPTYNAPAPPPALDFGTLQALTGGL